MNGNVQHREQEPNISSTGSQNGIFGLPEVKTSITTILSHLIRNFCYFIEYPYSINHLKMDDLVIIEIN